MNWPATFHNESLESVFDPSSLIYLSPDGKTPLESIDPTKVYVVGGFVDRSVNKNQSAMRAEEICCPAVRLPIKEFFPECRHPVLNVNSVVEILIHYMDHGDWRESLQTCIPQRKIKDREQEQAEYNIQNIKTEEQLLNLPTWKLARFEFRKALERECIKKGQVVRFDKEEHDLKALEKSGIDIENISRYIIKVFIDGKEVSEGKGKSIRVATAYASWRALKQCGMYDNRD